MKVNGMNKRLATIVSDVDSLHVGIDTINAWGFVSGWHGKMIGYNSGWCG